MAIPFKYYLFYKPYQVLTQFSAVPGKQTLADWVQVPKDVYPVGRLDYDSEGMLLLTNDSSLNQQMLHPSNGHTRTYWVQVEGIVTDEAITAFMQGVNISINGKNYKTLPAKAFRIDNTPDVPPREPPVRFRANIPTSWLALTLCEGKNRQVRRMTAAVGFPTLRLVRYSIGQMTIDQMQPGMLMPIKKVAF